MRPLIPGVIVVAAVVVAGCVRADRFRYVRQQPACFGSTTTDPLPGAPGENRDWASLDCRSALYSVGFIEFDGQGRAVDPTQEAKLLKLIEHTKQTTPGRKVITVLYIHGWKNNASQADPGAKPRDVERFQTALTELGYRSRFAAENAEDGARAPVPVIGVYIGWPGKSLMGPGWFNFASYWGRRNTANRVGDGPDLAPALNRIIDATNAGGGSRVLMVGHSFGARVLEHAIETGKVNLFTPSPGAPFVQPRVDLVLYVNSANDARLSMRRVQALRDHPLRVRHPEYDAEECKAPGAERLPRCRSYPLLVAITSTGDSATKYLLPAANTVNLDNSAPMPTPPAGDFLDPLPPPGIYRRAAAGHLPFMQSHVTRRVDCPTLDEIEAENSAADGRSMPRALRMMRLQKRTPRCDDDPACAFGFRTQGEEPACFLVEEKRPLDGRRPFNTTAFWIMAVDPVVVKDHNDIWNLSLVEMLAELMASRGFFEPDAGRAQIREGS
jgi:hypothetical protein